MRIGYGYCPGRVKERSDKYIILAGVKLPWRVGLMSFGNCDHDVLSLAAAEAIIGALGMGSLKECPRFDLQNTEGLQILEQAAALAAEKGYRLGNMDVQVLVQEVQFAKYLPEIKASLCSALGCGSDRLNLKLDHELWMGYTGNYEGINATAVCLLEN